MVNIENVDLRTRGVELPSDRVGVVVEQPFLSLTSKEPFVCTPETVATQLATIQKTLDIAKARPHGQAKTHFTIFPEYGIPGLPGVQTAYTFDQELAHPAPPGGAHPRQIFRPN